MLHVQVTVTRRPIERDHDDFWREIEGGYRILARWCRRGYWEGHIGHNSGEMMLTGADQEFGALRKCEISYMSPVSSIVVHMIGGKMPGHDRKMGGMHVGPNAGIVTMSKPVEVWDGERVIEYLTAMAKRDLALRTTE